MLDLRPVGFVIGLIVAVLGLTMLAPLAVDWALGEPNADAFLASSASCVLIGLMTAVACHGGGEPRLTIRQAFLLTLGIWGLVPLFGALPFMLGAPNVRLIDAYFEAVSGITTTGASVFVDTDSLPPGVNLWRGMLNWLGGLGIAFVAMIFLPVMRVGGMQFFRTEGFDTFGKILPRAVDIARNLILVYVLLTVACIVTYAALGMEPLDAVVHGFATIATGGFSPTTQSFDKYTGAEEYAGALFMVLGSLPYIRYVQMLTGSTRPLLQDSQVRAYLRWLAYSVALITIWRLLTSDAALEPAFRTALFNTISIMSSTGFSSGGFAGWGGFALLVVFVLGIVGACSGSSAAGLSVFRVQISLGTIAAQIRQTLTPHSVNRLRYEGRVVEDEVLDQVILYVYSFVFLTGILSVLMTLTGVDFLSSILAVWTSIGNIGYTLGPITARTGTFVDLPDLGKLIMILAMLMGRIALLAFLVVLLPRFWRS
jgi:trk system potassium uptake protein TrkH